VAEGEADGEALLSLFFFDELSVEDFLVSLDDDFLVEDFLVVEVLAGDFSGAVVLVEVSVLLVLHELISPATSITVME
jgi:hypothetical protein